MQIKALHTEMATLAMQSLITLAPGPATVLPRDVARHIAASAIVMADAMVEALIERETALNAPDIDDEDDGAICRHRDLDV